MILNNSQLPLSFSPRARKIKSPLAVFCKTSTDSIFSFNGLPRSSCNKYVEATLSFFKEYTAKELPSTGPSFVQSGVSSTDAQTNKFCSSRLQPLRALLRACQWKEDGSVDTLSEENENLISSARKKMRRRRNLSANYYLCLPLSDCCPKRPGPQYSIVVCQYEFST